MEKERIIQKVCEQINQKDIKFLFWYGTRPGRDIDLLAVLKKKTKVRLCEPSKSKLEILMIDNSEFIRRLELLDPLVTDPLVTGFLLLGDENKIGMLRSDVILSLIPSKRVSKETIQFLKNEAHKRFKNAGTLLEKRDNTSLYSFLVELSWACSYSAFVNYYRSSPKFLPITLDHLLVLDGHVVLKKVIKSLESVKSSSRFNKSQAIDLFKKSQRVLEAI